MAGVTVPEIMTAMATKLGTLPDIDHAYPAPPGRIDGANVSIVLFWDETAITPDMSSRLLWLPLIKAQIVVPQRNDTLEEFPLVWAQITPVMEAFASGTVAQVLPSLAGKVDRIMPAGRDRPAQPTLQVPYGGKSYLCSEVFWSLKFHRNVEVTP